MHAGEGVPPREELIEPVDVDKEKVMLPLYATDRKPYVLENVGPTRILAVRIGAILTELWEYRKGDASPYARLVKEGGESPRNKAIREIQHQAVLSPMEALVVVGVIEECKALWTSGFRTRKSPCAIIQVDRLIIKLYNPTRHQSAYAEFTFAGSEAKLQSVLLSPTEATVLAGTIGGIVPDCDCQT